MTYTIVHRIGILIPWCISCGITNFLCLSLISGYFFECGIIILSVVSKVMPYFKCPNGTAGGRFTGYAASWRHNSFNLYHFRPYFLSSFLLIMPQIAPNTFTRAIQALVVTLQSMLQFQKRKRYNTYLYCISFQLNTYLFFLHLSLILA